MKWLDGGSRYTLEYWRSKNPNPTKEDSLAEKYAGIWLHKVEARKKQRKPCEVSSQNWLRLLLFAPSSRAVRETVCGVLENLCKVCLSSILTTLNVYHAFERRNTDFIVSK